MCRLRRHTRQRSFSKDESERDDEGEQQEQLPCSHPGATCCGCATVVRRGTTGALRAYALHTCRLDSEPERRGGTGRGITKGALVQQQVGAPLVVRHDSPPKKESVTCPWAVAMETNHVRIFSYINVNPCGTPVSAGVHAHWLSPSTCVLYSSSRPPTNVPRACLSLSLSCVVSAHVPHTSPYTHQLSRAARCAR